MDLKKNKWIIALVSSTCFGLIVTLVLWTNLFDGIQLKIGDTFQGLNEVRKDIVIVGVDEKTIAPNSLGSVDYWSRTNWAQAIRNLSKYNPKVVGIDFYYQNPGDENGDNNFANILKSSGPVVHIYRMNPSAFNSDKFYIQQKGTALNGMPYSLFTDIVNVSVSAASALQDSDKVVRRIMPFIYDEETGKYYENFAFAIARIALNAQEKPIQPLFTSNSYRFDNDISSSSEIPLENGQMLIRYSSIPFVNNSPNNNQKSYQYVSFLDLYNNDFSSYKKTGDELFKDKIVLIGPQAFSFKDSWNTPITAVDLMYGVEIHANAIQTILDRAFLRNISFAEKVILIFTLAILSTFVFLFTRIRWSLIYLLTVGFLYGFIAPYAFQQGLILDFVHPYIVLVLSFISTYIYRYVTEFKEKNELKNAFGKYVNPTLVKQITEHPEALKLGGEKRPVTVLFTDIAHFTTISESLTPESLVALLNEYFDAMSEVILGQGGTLDKFEGDAIMAFFGAPIPYSDHALRAANAAIGMRHRLNELLAKWKNDPPLPGGEKKPMIDFRCGLSSGDVIVGNVGSKERFEYTVMGDIVNLGSRLEGANKKYSTNIMVSEATYLMIKDMFETRELDTIRVVGKTKPIKVYELLAIKGGLPADAQLLLTSYNEGISLYHERKYAEALKKFQEILQKFPADGPCKMYIQRCEVLRDFPRPADWDEVFEMGSK